LARPAVNAATEEARTVSGKEFDENKSIYQQQSTAASKAKAVPRVQTS